LFQITAVRCIALVNLNRGSVASVNDEQIAFSQ